MQVRLILIGIHIILVLSLLPWLSLAFWFANFLNDAIQAEPPSDLIIIEVTSHLLVLLYPIFVAYGIVSSWVFFKKKSSKSKVFLNAISPVLFLSLGIILFFLPFFIMGLYQSFMAAGDAA